MHCEPNRSLNSRNNSGRAMAAVLTDTLSAPARSRRSTSATLRTPPPTVERDEDLLGGAGDDVDHGAAVRGGGGDVEEGQLVGALGVVAGRQFDGIACITQVFEIDTLHDTPGVDVEAGNDTYREAHACASLPLGSGMRLARCDMIRSLRSLMPAPRCRSAPACASRAVT